MGRVVTVERARALLEEATPESVSAAIDLLRADTGSAAVYWLLGEALETRFWLVGDEDSGDLDDAVGALEEAFAVATGDEAAGVAADLGALLHARYLIRSGADDLDAAIDLLTRATPGPGVAATLGRALTDRHALNQDGTDRDEAITWLRRACDALVLPDEENAFDLLRLAMLLIDRAEASRDALDLTAAIGYAQRSVTGEDAELLGHSLCTLGVGHLLRAQGDDLRLSAGHLRAAARVLPEEDPAQTDVGARLGIALAAQVINDVAEGVVDALGERAHEAAGLLATARRELPDGDPVLGWVRYSLAVTLAVRFVWCGGDDDDCRTALAELETVLGRPDLDTLTADRCHLFTAFLLAVRPLPAYVRTQRITADPRVFGHLMGTRERIAPDVARTILDHLDRLSEAGAALPGLVSWLRGFATMMLGSESPSRTDFAALAGLVEQAIAEAPEDDRDGFRAMLELLRAQATPQRSPESILAAIERLGDDHWMRPLLMAALGAGLTFSESRVPSTEESAAAIDMLEAVLDGIPEDHPGRQEALMRLAGSLVRQVFVSDHYAPRLRAVREQLAALTSADPQAQALNLCLLGMVEGMEALSASDPSRVTAATERLKQAAAVAPDEPRIRQLVRLALTGLLSQRYMRGGELEYLDAATRYADDAVRAADGDEGDLLISRYFLACAPIVRHRDRMDPALLEEAISQLESVRERLPEGHYLRPAVASDLHQLRLLLGAVGPGGLDPGAMTRDPGRIAEAADAVVAVARAMPTDHPFYAHNLTSAGNARAMQGFMGRDRRLINEGIALLTEAYTAAEAVPRYRPQVAVMLAMALHLRHAVSGDRADLTNAIARTEEARRQSQEAGDDLEGASLLYVLADAYYRRNDANLGDRRRAVETGLEGLRRRSESVMLQGSTDRALLAALAAAGEGADVARWCLGSGRPEAAVEALERGRGMVLCAATADADVPFMLREEGHGELAAEWETALRRAEQAAPAPWDFLPGVVASLRAQPGAEQIDLPEARVPSDLRYRVLRALSGSELDRLLAPPSVAEIAESLRAAGARALAYLLPRDEGGAGLAVVVDDAGDVREIPLPRLLTGERGPVAAFARAQRELRAGDERWREALGRLCDWAWRAAMEDVLDAVADGPRPVRLVLVPVGDLGLVPWHAARRPVADGRLRHACQDAIISYAGSARQFTEACAHPHRPWRSAAALVRVPESTLYFATKEIRAILDRHYAGGRLLGDARRPSTPDNVRALLPRRGAAGASLIHLGCHAEMAARPVDGRLILQGGSLSMRDILNQARARPRDLPGCLVVLAACVSDLTGAHHDEALALTTSFLAAGAVGAIGTRWPVDDLPTLSFMIMFHHYLNSGYDDPATALRAAQTWMLNPRRSYPEGFTPKTAEMVRTVDLTEPECWAAFTYNGQ